MFSSSLWSLYQSLDESSPMRFHVYLSLVQLAGKTEQIGAIYTDIQSVKSQFAKCPPSTEQMQKLLRLLHEVLLTCKKSEEASQVRIGGIQIVGSLSAPVVVLG